MSSNTTELETILTRRFPEKTDTAILMMEKAVIVILKELIIRLGKDVKNVTAIKTIKDFIEIEEGKQ